MKIIPSSLSDVLIIEPQVFKDDRGFFMETFQRDRYAAASIKHAFVQDNLSFSAKGVLRGLHYQFPHAQAKLVQVLKGEVFDVAVDIRRGSPTFGQWTGARLSDRNNRQLFVPEGFAHGFCVLSETALFTYKCSDFYSPASEKGIIWDDPDIAVSWPISRPLLSDKDSRYSRLKDVSVENLPVI